MQTIFYIQGAKGGIHYTTQGGESAARQYRRIRRLVGRITAFYEVMRRPGTARGYDEASATMPKRAADQFADYLRELGPADSALLRR
jgi:hypothetical protein